MTFPDLSFLEPLERLINHPNPDVRASVAGALGQIKDKKAAAIISKQLAVEDDKDVIEALEQALDEL